MKPPITLSVNPWYYCNFRCGFCYLTEEQLSNTTKLSLDRLEDMLKEVQTHYEITHIDLYGGEVFLLPKGYLRKLKDILTQYVDVINVNTNLSVINELVQDSAFDISVSYDFEAREKHEQVAQNMLLLERPFNVLMLASPALLKKKPEEIISFFNMFAQLRSVEVKPYSANQANDLKVKNNEFEKFVKSLIVSPLEKQFELYNEVLLDEVVHGERNAFSDDHIYITPNGSFATLEFDENDREYFFELGSVEDYQHWTEMERTRVNKNKHCQQCEYKGQCLSEHLREVTSMDESCNGFYHLINWWKANEST